MINFKELMGEKYPEYDINRRYFNPSDIVQLNDNQTVVVVIGHSLYEIESIVIKDGFYYRKGIYKIPIDKFPYFTDNEYEDYDFDIYSNIKKGVDLEIGDIVLLDGEKDRVGIVKGNIENKGDKCYCHAFVLSKDKLKIDKKDLDLEFHKFYDDTIVFYIQQLIYYNTVKEIRWDK